MSLVRAGLIVRALRRHQRLRQVDLAGAAGVSQQAVSRIERGEFGPLSVEAYLRVVGQLGAEIDLNPKWRGPKLASLLDARHAAMQNHVTGTLVSGGWLVRPEYTFNHFGDRGSVDILGWLALERALLLTEIKPDLLCVEETMRILDMKLRVVPALVKRELGWDVDPSRIGCVLVLPASSQQRDLVDRHSSSLRAALPERTVDVRRWLAEPDHPLRAIWFVRDTHSVGDKSKPATPRSCADQVGGLAGENFWCESLAPRAVWRRLTSCGTTRARRRLELRVDRCPVSTYYSPAE